MEPAMKVTVFGATGGIGRQVVGQLCDAGHEVTAVLRRGKEFGEQRARMVVVPGLEVAAPLVQAMTGSDCVISAVGPRTLRDGPVASTAANSILGAMRQAGVRRFVAVSATPVIPAQRHDGPLLRFILQPLIRAILADLYLDLARMEGMMAGSGLDWTAVRPPRLNNGPLTAAYRTRHDANVPHGYRISRADVAHAMIAAAADPAASGHAIGVAN
jgi:putative NADH-flavin reductase